MNQNLLKKEVQAYLNTQLNTEPAKIALSKSPFEELSSAELANQIAAKKKAEKKLTTWFKQENIVYPSTLSIEQTSSEETALYKSKLAFGNSLIDLTAGFGVDSYYFSKTTKEVFSCEIEESLAAINQHNTKVLGVTNIRVINTDGLEYLKKSNQYFDTIYLDPARRKNSSKVFKLADCTPNVVEYLDFLMQKSKRIIIKTSPLLDIHAGLNELKNIKEIHIVSVKNECKELLWILEPDFEQETQIIITTLNQHIKTITLPLNDSEEVCYTKRVNTGGFLYEPDTALMKSGNFNAIAKVFNLEKLDQFSHLYRANTTNTDFMGRIFLIEEIIHPTELKKIKNIKANIIVRNYPDKAENLIKKYKISSAKDDFLIFTKHQNQTIIIKAKIIQYY